MFSGSLAEKALALVSVASVTGQEQQLCDLLADWLRATFPRASVLRWRNGLALQPRPLHPDRPTLALVGHLDTVPPAKEQDLGIRDGCIWGCGASDMKAGLAVILEVLEHSTDSGCNLVGIFYDREEGPLEDNGLTHLLDLVAVPNLAIVLEPTNNRIQAGCVGSLHARLTFEGRRAHSARPWEGENAIFQALPVLSDLRDRARQAVEVSGLTFFEVMTPTMAWTEGTRNVVPATFHVNVNCRFGPGRTQAEALADLTTLVGGRARLEMVDSAPSGQVSLDNPYIEAWAARASLQMEAKQAWTDVAQLTSRGIPAVNFGPGEPAYAHQAQENVAISAMHDCRESLKLLIDQLG
jgi:succinyl-diaminopimelate desuccinylase